MGILIGFFVLVCLGYIVFWFVSEVLSDNIDVVLNVSKFMGNIVK